jgi:DNA-binding XRE family transcriptional regulator
MNAIRPIAKTRTTVTLRRADFDALLEAIEDASDVAHFRRVERAAKRGETTFLPVETVERRLAGEHPLRRWRKQRRMTAATLAKAAGVTTAEIARIEGRKARGSRATLRALAVALGVAADDLIR